MMYLYTCRETHASAQLALTSASSAALAVGSRRKVKPMKDVVVVGARLGGLSAGWRLRQWDTLLLEADERVGGRIHSEGRGN